MLKFKFLSIGYLLSVIGLFLYSYTQVDLNLTLSQWSIWQVIQKAFQQVGWFQRPLSTAIYLVILLSLFTFYLSFLGLVKKGKLSGKQFWRLIIISSVILLFSYNAFSYDLFNYLFDARIFTFHGQNPYLFKALDFPRDPWTNFMRWTHRTYPYGPVWLGLTIPLSYLGFQVFLPTLFLFKALMVGSFLGTVYFIGRILEKISPEKKLLGMAFFAFNPLVIIESLVSAHQEVVMLFFSIAAFWFLLNKKYLPAFLFLLLSVGIKFATAFFLPLFLIVLFWGRRRQKIDWEKIFLGALVLMLAAVILASQRTELQPWYLVWVLPFVSLLTKRKWLLILSFTLSLGLLLHYVPFLYTGNWNSPIPTIKFWLTTGSLILGILVYLGKRAISNKRVS